VRVEKIQVVRLKVHVWDLLRIMTLLFT